MSNVSKDVSVDDMKNNGFYGCVYDISIDCDGTDTGDILDVHKYLMVKDNIR